jgi:hypothetical protein
MGERADGDGGRQYPVICSWCGTVTGFSSVENSHGMCRPCFGDVWGDFAASACEARVKAAESGGASRPEN